MTPDNSLRVFVATAVAVAVIGRSASAQVPASSTKADRQWAGVAGRTAGSSIEVERRDRSRVKGAFEVATADLITVTAPEGVQRVARADVSRVRVPSRGKRILFGSIGVAAGALGGFFVCPYCSNEYGGHPTEIAALTGGLLGSLLFLVPRYTTIYRGSGR